MTEWAELEAHERRAAPRFDAREYGSCPVCRLGATAILNVGPISWAACERCAVRWPAGVGVLPTWFGAAASDQEVTIPTLAAFEELPRRREGA